MQITIDIPEDKKAELIDAFANRYGYQTKIDGEDGEPIDNPVSKGQFALNVVRSFIKEVYIADKANEVEAQRQAAMVTADSEIDVITVT